MKKSILSLLICVSLSSIAQTDVNLNLIHEFDGSPFAYGQYYVDAAGNNIEFNRVQYYLSNIAVESSVSSQVTVPDDTQIISANIINYPLGSVNATNITGVNFNVGVPNALNHADITLQPTGHPLSYQSPSMHWGWASGYRFLVIEGKVDDNGDGTPNKLFQFHVVGDQFFTAVGVTSAGVVNGADLDINITVNVADWIKNMNMINAGINHGSQAINGQVMDNTNPETVFEGNVATEIITESKSVNQLIVDYEYSYAPTLFYSIGGATNASILITDLNGRIISNEVALPAAGNYFINKELSKGLYVVRIIGDNDHIETTKMFIK
tara:strand:+ start:4034 stop:5005 length:972 start_codon:yes stop_codon:yes gene_type:complete